MKSCAKFAILMAALAMGPAVRAQSCYSPIINWQGKYALVASGTAGTTSQYAISQDSVMNMNMPVARSNGSNLTCNTWQWIGYPDVNSTASVNDTWKAHSYCHSGDFFLVETVVGNTPSLRPHSPATLTVDLSKGTYTFAPDPTANVNETIFNCDGTKTQSAGMWPNAPVSNWPLTFALPTSVQSLVVNNFAFQGESFFALSPIYNVPWTFSFTLDPIVNIDDPCKKRVGSSIGCQNQSLGEDVPVVGTGFQLHYESARAFGSGADALASIDAFKIGGWTLSVHHAYNPYSNTLFLGNGKQRSGWQLGVPVTWNGNTLVTSEDGSEVYTFSGSTGQHLQTLKPLTGALVYQFGYDAAGNLVTVTDANGNVTSIQRDASEHATAIVSPYGQTTTLSVDSNGFLSHVTDPLGKSATFTNTSTGLLTARTDENGNVYTYTYDAQGRLIKDADPAGGYTALSRTKATSGLGSTVAQTTAMGRTSSFQTTLTVPWVPNATSTFSEQLKNTWPNGLQATKTNIQSTGQLSKSFTLPDGTADSQTQGPDPVWGIQVPVTTSQTHTLGSLTMSITGARTATLGTAGNPFSLTSQTDKQTINGRTYTSAFTTSNRTFVDTTPVGRKLTTVLDTKERIASTQVAGLLASGLSYDSRGRLSTVTQGTRSTNIVYDSNGRPASVTDPLGRKNSFIYDADGRLLSTTLADGRIIDYQHDANGNLTAVIPPGKSAHDFNYTSVNLMSEYLPPAASVTGPTTYTYNADKDITKLTTSAKRKLNVRSLFAYSAILNWRDWATGTVTDTHGKTIQPRGGSREYLRCRAPLPHEAKEHVIREPLLSPSLETVFEVSVNGRVHKIPGVKLQRWIMKRRSEWKGPRGMLFSKRPILGP